MSKVFSIILKLIIIACVVVGIVLNSFSADFDGYAHWLNRFMYFTTQSNIWIAVTMLIILIYSSCKKSNSKFKHILYVFKFIFTVSIAVTGVVYCAFLGPNANPVYHPWSISSCFLHIIVPALAVLDFFLDDYKIIYSKNEIWLSLIPPLVYCVLSAILFYIGIDFGRGDNFPYFFLNFASPAGFFGFSNELPYIMGSFYWLLIFSLLILSLGFVLAKLHPNTLKNNILRKKSFLVS